MCIPMSTATQTHTRHARAPEPRGCQPARTAARDAETTGCTETVARDKSRALNHSSDGAVCRELARQLRETIRALASGVTSCAKTKRKKHTRTHTKSSTEICIGKSSRSVRAATTTRSRDRRERTIATGARAWHTARLGDLPFKF